MVHSHNSTPILLQRMEILCTGKSIAVSKIHTSKKEKEKERAKFGLERLMEEIET